MAKRTRGNPTPLIVEQHPQNYKGYPFITLIQYRDQYVLTIVDNVDDKTIDAYVLDLCGPERLSEEVIINLADDWWTHRRDQYPISFDFSRLGIANDMSKIYRTFNIDYVSRVIGPLPKFDMTEVVTVKRKRKKSVPQGMAVQYKSLI